MRRIALGIVDLLRRHPIVEAVARMGDVPKPVPLARALEIEAVEPVVASKATRTGLMAHRRAAERRWVGQRDVPVEREDLPRTHERGTLLGALGGEQIQRAELVIRTEESPCRPRRVVSGQELAIGRKFWGKHGARL
jgi:hypothetical protein